jgi:serum/glucocorticoid-regulated kinase 2
MGWMVFGSKKLLGRNNSSANNQMQVQYPEQNGTNYRLTTLDVVLAAASEMRFERIEPSELSAVSVLGRGGCGKVILMRCEDGRLIAVKEVHKSNLMDKPGTVRRSVRPVSTKIEHAEMENLVLHTVSSHPLITSFHGSFQTRDKIFLQMEYCGGGELFQHMQRQGVFQEDRVRLYTAEIVSVLEFLHHNGIMYRDLKPENILLDDKGHIRITDFGLSTQFNKQGDDNLMRCHSICGTPEYIAPEIILLATTLKDDRTATYGKTVDWWALGVLMYEMLYRVPPFYHRDRKTMLNKILACQLSFPKPAKGAKPVSVEAKDFIASLLKFDEEDRLGYGNNGSENVKSHPFFACLDWEKVAAAKYEPSFVPDLSDECDTSNFDSQFTKEILREDPVAACPYHLELTGYEYLPEEFAEAVWYKEKGTSILG